MPQKQPPQPRRAKGTCGGRCWFCPSRCAIVNNHTGVCKCGAHAFFAEPSPVTPVTPERDKNPGSGL